MVAHLALVRRGSGGGLWRRGSLRGTRGAAARNDIDSGKLGSADESRFFAADTNVLAAADLQNRLKQLIEERRGEVSSLSQRAAQEESPFPPVSVTASFRSSIASLVDLVRVLESSSPALFIEELSVQSMHQQGRVLPSRDIELEARITVTGYRFVSGGGA